MKKKENNFDFELLVRYMLPKDILDSFEITGIHGLGDCAENAALQLGRMSDRDVQAG